MYRLLIIREVTLHNAWGTLSVSKERLVQFFCIPNTEHLITTTCCYLRPIVIQGCTVRSTRVFLKSLCTLSWIDIPNFACAITRCREESLTIREVTKVPDSVCVACQSFDTFWVGVPNHDSFVMRTWRELSILLWIHTDGIDWVSMLWRVIMIGLRFSYLW